MALRSWAIRGLILAGVAAVVALGWVASSWVSPEHVRAQVIAHLNEQFDGVEVHVGSAHMRLLGGIAVSDIRITRPGPEGQTPLLIVPSAVLYHDKEQLNRGRLVIKKVELDKPELHLERGPDGKWNLAAVLKPTPVDRTVPTFVVKGGTVHLTDHGPDPLPPLTLTDATLTLLNDPLPVLAVQVKTRLDGFGPLTARAKMNRITGTLVLGLEMPEFPLGEVAATVAARFAPDLAPHLTGLAATAAVSADLSYTPDAPVNKWRHDVRFELKGARFTHPDLPWPAEQLGCTAQVVDGRLKVDELTAVVNGAKVKLSLETRADAVSGGRQPAELRSHAVGSPAPHATNDTPLKRLEHHLQRFDLSVAGVALDDALFQHLPDQLKQARRMFSPVGQVDVGYRFAREGAGWRREVELRPRQITVAYEKFQYPVADVRGQVKRTTTHAAEPVVTVDLVGTAGGQLITIKGAVTGDGDDPGINLRITGANVPLDDKLVAALSPKYAALVRRFRANGRGDFVAEIVQKPGINLCENEFRIDIRDATVNHEQFPLPLQKVKGRLVIRVATCDLSRPVRPGDPPGPPPERDEIILDGFTAVHSGAAVWLNGSKRPIPGSRDQKLTLHVGGNSCPLDADLKAAVTALGVGSVWDAFAPRGAITFTAHIDLIDRAPPVNRPDFQPPVNPVTDLKLTFDFSGPTVTPSFFPYELTDFTAWVEYKNGRADVAHVAGRHGETRVRLAEGDVRFYPDGVIWANLAGLEMKPVVADAALTRALPGKLGPGLAELKLKGGVELLVKRLVVLTPPENPTAALPDPMPVGLFPASGGRQSPEGAPLGGQTPSARQVPRAQSPVSHTTAPDPVVYWDAEVRLAGASLDTGVSWEQVFGAVACRGRYEGTHQGLLRGAMWFDRAVIAGQPLSRLSARVRGLPQQPDPARPGQYLPPELEFTDLAGDLFHGLVGGEARVMLTDPVRFDLWLTATDVQLDEIARHYKLGSDADLKGIAQAQLRLFNRPDPKTGQLVTEGLGKIDVPTGRMYNLPILLDLVKLARGQAPDRTAFEEAHAVFSVHGDRVRVEQVDLIGKAICLGGAGELDTSGDYVKFDFYTIPSQVLAKLINTPVGDLTAFLSKTLFKIKLTRENGELKYRPEPVPLVTEPARLVADRLRARSAKMFGSGK